MQFVTDYLFLYSIEHKSENFREKIDIAIIVINMTKIALTSTLIVKLFKSSH